MSAERKTREDKMSTKLASTRTERAAQIISAAGVTVRNSTDRTFDVQSQTNAAKVYRVNLKRCTCECKDYERRPEFACKHILAAQKFETLQAEQATATSARTFKNYDALFAALT